MSSNVGLTTPRGTGTSGYVQRNLSQLKPRPQSSPGHPYPTSKPPHQIKPSAEILQHARLRDIEIQILSLRDSLEEQTDPPIPSDEVDQKCDALREKLTAELDRGGGKRDAKKGAKRYQVHDLAEAKIKESERLRRALGLKGDEVGEGDKEGDAEHPMARQERRRREREEERFKREEGGDER